LTKSKNAPRPGLLRGRKTAWAGAALGVVVLAGSLASIPLATAQAANGASTTMNKTVVRVVTRTPSGSTTPVKMLATVKGASLYFAPSTGCTGGCLSVWPPLEIAAGKTPKGIGGLGTTTVMIGKKTHDQVTYLGKPLYAFVDDSGTSVNGNGVAGFSVAKVH
jgi:predicted lipoprotein with Yx(FWY)xxD motif